MRVRSPLKTVGGKAAAADRIIAAFPPASAYTTYCEPFGGVGHVIFAKDPYNHAEIYNDLSNNLYIFFAQLRDNAGELQQHVDGLLYSRAQYYDFYKSLFDGSPLEPLERAVRFFYCLRCTGTGWLRKSPPGWNCTHSNVQAFRSATELFPIVRERLRYVAIDNRDCLKTITRYDSPKTLLYCDPPYFNAHQYYEASRDGFDHVALAKVLNSATGYVALSYYDCSQIKDLYPAPKWRCMRWEQAKHTAIKDERPQQVATELLLMNYSPHVGGLFDERQVDRG